VVGPCKCSCQCSCSLNVGNCLAEDLLASQEQLCSMELVAKVTKFCFSCKNRPALNVTLVPDMLSLAENQDVAKLPGIH
jgi:hypothetical protein